MPLVNSRDILQEASERGYGVPSLLAGNLEMIVGQLRAAEERKAPLILAFNQAVTPQVPMALGVPLMVSAAQRSKVPVATVLDHGRSLEDVVKAIHLGSSSVMFDGSGLPYEENVRQTEKVVRIAHAVGVDVEAELGSIGGSATEVGASTAAGVSDDTAKGDFTDPDLAADFVRRTGVDALAISFGNMHGIYHGTPELALDRVRQIRQAVDVPLVMHGASGLAESEYGPIIDAGISKICYYTAMARTVTHDLKNMLVDAEEEELVYHHVIAKATDYFYTETKRLLDILGCSHTQKG